jgi:hypothetical protein
MIQYGQQWPDHATQLTIELACYREGLTVEQGALGAEQHFVNAFRIFYPPEFWNHTPGHEWNEWTEKRVRNFVRHGFMTWWGCASSIKSTDAAAILLLDWLADPVNTCTLICSTTRSALEKRIWSEIVRLYMPYESVLPAKLVRSRLQVLNEPLVDPKAGIHGVAIMAGNVEDSTGNLLGHHKKRVRLAIDEMQSTHAAAVEAVINLSTGCQDFRFIGLGNPQSYLDPLGEYSKPVNGWKSISTDSDEWETTHGICLRFDGVKSPGMVDPKKFWFMMRQDNIDKIKKWEGSINTRKYWSQVRAFIPAGGTEDSPISDAFLISNRMMEDAIWSENGYNVVAGCDPAFSSGGDRCVLIFARVGLTPDGHDQVEFQEPIIIPLEVTGDKALTYFLADEIKRYCLDHGVMPDNLAVDCSGTQGAIVDIIETGWSRGIMRTMFGTAPTDLQVSFDDPRKAREVYANRVTELWLHAYNYGRYGQIRGIRKDVAQEFSGRTYDKKYQGSLKKIESKKEMKLRGLCSPDLADAHAVCLSLIRERRGMLPGGAADLNLDIARARADIARQHDIHGEEDAYLIDPITEERAD